MLRVFPKMFIFTATLSVGLLVMVDFMSSTRAPKPTLEASDKDSVNIAFSVPEASPQKDDQTTHAEFYDLPDDEKLDYPQFPFNFIDIYNTEGLLRRSEVVAKNGQQWLVMTEVNGRYVIKSAKASVRQLKTISYPGDEKDAKLSFDVAGTPVFAFRRIRNVQTGPVITVYLRPTWDEIERRNLPIDPMKTGFKRELNLNENWYTLRVSHATTKSGKPIGVLALENKGVQQIIARNYFELPYGTIIGELLWAGDIDNDGKLDLYFDEFNEKGYFSGGLYLSSHASKGELIKLAGTFSYAGC